LNLQWGAAYESSAIPDSTYDPSVPISDAIWLNAGGKYHFNRQFFAEAGIIHIIFKDRDVNLQGQFGETLKGSTTSKLNILHAQIGWSF
jgi:long-subunit fatty acid transport protein